VALVVEKYEAAYELHVSLLGSDVIMPEHGAV
jgi:hypothetical protein